MNKFNQNITAIEYDLKNSYVTITANNIIYWDLLYTITDNITTPNTIKTKDGGISAGTLPLENYEKEVNTLTNTTTYSTKNSAYIDNEYIDEEYRLDTNINLQLFSNSTGILEITEIK
jgi:hypothetical protein